MTLASWWTRFSKGKFHSVWKRQQRVWASVDHDWKHLTQQGWSLPSGVRSGLGEIKHLACIFAWRTILRTPLNTCPLAVNGPKCGPLWSDNSKAIKTLTEFENIGYSSPGIHSTPTGLLTISTGLASVLATWLRLICSAYQRGQMGGKKIANRTPSIWKRSQGDHSWLNSECEASLSYRRWCLR